MTCAAASRCCPWLKCRPGEPLLDDWEGALAPHCCRCPCELLCLANARLGVLPCCNCRISPGHLAARPALPSAASLSRLSVHCSLSCVTWHCSSSVGREQSTGTRAGERRTGETGGKEQWESNHVGVGGAATPSHSCCMAATAQPAVPAAGTARLRCHWPRVPRRPQPPFVLAGDGGAGREERAPAAHTLFAGSSFTSSTTLTSTSCSTNSSCARKLRVGVGEEQTAVRGEWDG